MTLGPNLTVAALCAGALLAAPPAMHAQGGQVGSAVPRPTIEMLLGTAKASLPDAPSELAAPYLLEIGRTEAMRARPGKSQPGLDDMARAFDQALQLSGGDEDTPQAKFRSHIKQFVEGRAVIFTAMLDRQQALALVRRADTPRASLYDTLLYGEGVSTRLEHKAPVLDVLAVVGECLRSGAFPYRGVTELIQDDAIPVDERLTLARMEVQYAGSDTLDDYELLNAPNALIRIHSTFPQMDGQTVDAATNILRLFDKIALGGKMAAGAARRNGTFLLSSLQQMDSSRAAELATTYPEFVASSATTASSDALFGALHKEKLAAAQDLPAVPPESAGSAMRFAAYAQRAQLLLKKSPAQSLDNAERAASLATPDLLSQDGMDEAVLQLAATFKTLGIPGRADELLGRALDALAASDLAREKAFREGDSQATQSFLEQQAGASDGEIWKALVLADRVNFPLTARRVLAWPGEITRIAALVGAAWGDAPNPNSIRPNRN